MKSQITLIIIISLIYFSCSDINSTNELGKGCVIDTDYFNNGKIKGIGSICDSLKNGKWAEFNGNGKLVWNGNYYRGTRHYDTTRFDLHHCLLFIKEDVKFLVPNMSYYFRVETDNIHPDDLLLSSNNGKILISDDPEYNYIIIPEKSYDIKLEILFVCNGEFKKISTKLLPVGKASH